MAQLALQGYHSVDLCGHVPQAVGQSPRGPGYLQSLLGWQKCTPPRDYLLKTQALGAVPEMNGLSLPGQPLPEEARRSKLPFHWHLLRIFPSPKSLMFP